MVEIRVVGAKPKWSTIKIRREAGGDEWALVVAVPKSNQKRLNSQPGPGASSVARMR